MTERLHFYFSLSCIGEGNGNPLQCSCLENPRDGGACWAAVYGVAQSQTRLKWLSSNLAAAKACIQPGMILWKGKLWWCREESTKLLGPYSWKDGKGWASVERGHSSTAIREETGPAQILTGWEMLWEGIRFLTWWLQFSQWNKKDHQLRVRKGEEKIWKSCPGKWKNNM